MKNNRTNEAILTKVKAIFNGYPKNFMRQGRDPARTADVLIKIQEIWEKNPDLRLGQLITIAAEMKKPVLDVFNIEDEELFCRLVNFDKRK